MIWPQSLRLTQLREGDTHSQLFLSPEVSPLHFQVPHWLYWSFLALSGRFQTQCNNSTHHRGSPGDSQPQTRPSSWFNLALVSWPHSNPKVGLQPPSALKQRYQASGCWNPMLLQPSDLCSLIAHAYKNPACGKETWDTQKQKWNKTTPPPSHPSASSCQHHLMHFSF